MRDVSLKCTLFRAQMVLSYCATKCPHAARGTLRCPDLVKLSNDQPAEMKNLIADVCAKGQTITDTFKSAFPATLPEGVPLPAPKPAAPPASTTTTSPTATTMQSPTVKATKVPEPSTASKVFTSALELKPAAPAVVAPKTIPAATSSKPAIPGGKEKTMADPENPVKPAADSVDTPVKKKGGLPKGYKFTKPRGSKAAASATGGTKSRSISMIFFVETEPKSGLFKIEPLKEFGDVMTILDGSNRRVIGAVSAREF